MRELLVGVLALLVLVLPTQVMAAGLRGQVLQGNGAPAGNEPVTLAGPQNAKGTTNGAGFYDFRDIPPGSYTLTVRGRPHEVRVPPQGTERNIRLP